MHSPQTGQVLVSSNYRADIDGLRAIAVLSVVAYHAFPNILGGGFVGVDIFFVISGFLISSILFESLAKGTFSLKEFYFRRIRRIFPALILVLVTCFVLGWFVLLPDEYKQLGNHIMGGAGFVSNLMLWNEAGYFDKAAETKPLLHLWSLGIEEQFYIAWPLFLYFAWRRFNLVLFIALILLGSFWLNTSNVDTDSVGSFYSPLARFWELLIGALLAYFKSQQFEGKRFCVEASRKLADMIRKQPFTYLSNRPRDVISTTGFALIAFGVLKITRDDAFPGWLALLPTLGAALLIIAGNDAWLNRNVLANRIVVWFGLISYPLYLWHWPLLTFARITESASPSNEIRFAAVILSIVLAALTYELLERPIRFGLHGSMKAITLCFLMILVGWLGIYTYHKNGFVKRPAFQAYELSRQALAEDVSMHNKENCTGSPDFPYLKLNNDFFCMQSSNDKHLPTNVVIGDSHSYPMYFGLYDYYVKKKGERLVLLGALGCPPFMGVESFEKGAEDSCRKFMETLLNWAEYDSEVKTLILVNRGPLYVSGSGYGEVGRHNWIIRRAAASSTETNAVAYKVALSDTIKHLQSHNKNIVLIMAPPELGFEPSSCVTRPLSLGHINLDNCGITYEKYLERSLEYRKIISEVAKGQSGLFVIDPSKSLCDKNFCWAYFKDNFLYSDNNHLTARGARKVINEFAIPF